jgi:addiction module RelE/StbE family toxin
MAELIWSDQALSDLENIYDYIAEDSGRYAIYTIQNIFEAAERLQMFPESGRNLPEFPEFPHREVILGNYRIIYRYDGDQNILIIVTVIHGSRLMKESYLSE